MNLSISIIFNSNAHSVGLPYEKGLNMPLYQQKYDDLLS